MAKSYGILDPGAGSLSRSLFVGPASLCSVCRYGTMAVLIVEER